MEGVWRKKELSTKSQKKVLNWLQFDESKQTTFCSVYDEFPAFVQLNWKEYVIEH